MSRFEVDRKGLVQLLEKKGWGWIFFELIQNAIDEDGVTQVAVTIEPIPGQPMVYLSVRDDAPEGFKDLADAWTLFKSSYKKADPKKRGRFSIGEKLVIALAEWASITTTTGRVTFEGEERVKSKHKTPAGSLVEVKLRLTRAQMDEALADVRRILVPAGVQLSINNEPIVSRTPVHSFEACLATEIADSEGVLRKTARMTTVRLYEPRTGEVPSLFEMGIPVVETNDRWHIDVDQKVPLTMDRDNVPPAYLRALRTETFNQMQDRMKAEDFDGTWVEEALRDDRVDLPAVERYLDTRFGTNRVVYDPGNPEANSRAAAAGFTVIPGSAFAKTTWSKIRDGGLVPASSRVFPPKVETMGKPIPADQWSNGMKLAAVFSYEVARAVIPANIQVNFVNTPSTSINACFGQRQLVFNVGRLGFHFFDDSFSSEGLAKPGEAFERFLALLIHELGHHFEENHLSDGYYRALCRLGAKIATLALTHPQLFQYSRLLDLGLIHWGEGMKRITG